MAASERLFAGSPHSAKDVYAAAAASKPLSFELPVKARIRNVTRSEDIRSPNIAAKLEGSDPTLEAEHVVYTAHIDHVGIGEPVKGDRIYNGALDNASGTSLLIELARAFSGMNPRPKRSILFVAVTGEESGLLGSDYFARFPTVPEDSIVANINMDQVLMLWPMRDVVAFGADHSSLGAVVEEAARRMGLSVGPDPMPEATIFIRSDQYSFVKQGIPAIMAAPGQKSDDPAIVPGEILGKWLGSRYHQPQDDMDQPLDWDAAVTFARFNFLCGYLVAQAPERPTWNKGDFFGERYGKKGKEGESTSIDQANGLTARTVP
jgi:Zn-dependent M28 family amino/carboxypeptidase